MPPPTSPFPMKLGAKQELFQRLKAEWSSWVFSHPGWALRAGEGRILPLGADGKTGRKAKLVVGQTPGGEPIFGAIVRVRDLVHKEDGLHYLGLAEDPQLFVDGVHITTSSHPAWQAAGANWKSRHPLCRWGGDFTPKDGNHISIEHNGQM